jgi:hypothetical protein
MSRALRVTLLCGALLAVTAPGAEAVVSWNTGGHNFGNQTVGSTSAPQSSTMTATCDLPDPGNPGFCLTFNHPFGVPAVSGAGFALTTPNTCAPGFLTVTTFPGTANCMSTVTFTPIGPGAHTGSLTTPTGPDIALSGTGVAAPASPVQTGATPNSPSTQPGKKCKKKKGKKRAAVAKKCKRKKR